MCSVNHYNHPDHLCPFSFFDILNFRCHPVLSLASSNSFTIHSPLVVISRSLKNPIKMDKCHLRNETQVQIFNCVQVTSLVCAWEDKPRMREFKHSSVPVTGLPLPHNPGLNCASATSYIAYYMSSPDSSAMSILDRPSSTPTTELLRTMTGNDAIALTGLQHYLSP